MKREKDKKIFDHPARYCDDIDRHRELFLYKKDAEGNTDRGSGYADFWKPGRGKAMEDLVPMYAEEYVDDPVLKQAVTYFRRWEWTQLYRELDEIVTEDPDYLDAYRLQAEAYMINKNYEAALSQLDRILERDRTDVHALGVTTVLMHILENEEGEKERLLALEKVFGRRRML